MSECEVVVWLAKFCTNCDYDVANNGDETDFKKRFFSKLDTMICFFCISVHKSTNAEYRSVVQFEKWFGDNILFFKVVSEFKTEIKNHELPFHIGSVRRGWGEKTKAAIEMRINSNKPDALARMQKTAPEAAEQQTQSQPAIPFEAPLEPPRSGKVYLLKNEYTDLERMVIFMLSRADSQYYDVRYDAICLIAQFDKKQFEILLAVKYEDPDRREVENYGINVILKALKAPDVPVVEYYEKQPMDMFAAIIITRLLTTMDVRELVLACGGYKQLLALVIRSTVPWVLREAGGALVALGKVNDEKAMRDQAIHKLTTFMTEDAERVLGSALELESVAADFLSGFDATDCDVSQMKAFFELTTFVHCKRIRDLGRMLEHLEQAVSL